MESRTSSVKNKRTKRRQLVLFSVILFVIPGIFGYIEFFLGSIAISKTFMIVDKTRFSEFDRCQHKAAS
jgi:hypothetical protein